MEISIDGGEFKDIDLYAESRKTKQIVYESETLEYGEHTATIRVSGRKNERSTGISGHLDGAFVLDNNGAGLVEFEKISARVSESTKNPEFKVIRKGGTAGRSPTWTGRKTFDRFSTGSWAKSEAAGRLRICDLSRPDDENPV